MLGGPYYTKYPNSENVGTWGCVEVAGGVVEVGRPTGPIETNSQGVLPLQNSIYSFEKQN